MKKRKDIDLTEHALLAKDIYHRGKGMKARVSGVPYPVELEGPGLTDQELQEIVLAVMTSGMRQKGARYNLPESMLMEIGKRCFDKGYTAGQKGENDGKTYS
jgi:hypothetical protein